MERQKINWLDLAFNVTVIVKGIDGVIEIIGGIILLVVPLDQIHGFASRAIYELHEDNHNFIAGSLAKLDGHLTTDLALFAALYLLIHGFVKIGLVTALLSHRYKLYPAAIVILILFTMYQAYEFVLHPSLALGVLTVFDLAIVGLTYAEWRRHTSKSALPEA